MRKLYRGFELFETKKETKYARTKRKANNASITSSCMNLSYFQQPMFYDCS